MREKLRETPQIDGKKVSWGRMNSDRMDRFCAYGPCSAIYRVLYFVVTIGVLQQRRTKAYRHPEQKSGAAA